MSQASASQSNHPAPVAPPRRLGNVYEIIVIGAGGVGSAAAYHAARAGRRVLLLEQFTVGHSRGSSHGGSRIIRYTHDKVAYADQMPATFALWRELEQLSGAPLLQMTGGLYLGPAHDPWLVKSRQVLAELAFSHRLLTGSELRQTYPQFRLPLDWIGLEQADSGILAASRCVAVMVAQAVQFGATVREQAPVAAVQPDGDGVSVWMENGEVFYADQAIIAAGPWASRFVNELITFPVPLRVTQQQVAYFPVKNPADFAVGCFPIFIVNDYPHFYGFPTYERAGAIKIAVEQTERTVDPSGPRTVDQNMVAQLSAIVGDMMNGVETTPVEVVPCLYTETPTHDFVIDRHPQHPQIVIAAGFSGRGFKHTIAIGRLLVDLALTSPGHYTSPFWREIYHLSRFVSATGPATTNIRPSVPSSAGSTLTKISDHES